MTQIRCNEIATLEFQAAREYALPFREVEFSVRFTNSDGASVQVPGFWDGGSTWKARFAYPQEGTFTYVTTCNQETDAGLHERTGSLSVAGQGAGHALATEGPLAVSADRRRFAHVSQKPFAWLGDTWWMGLTRRLPLDGFKELIADRVEKGFSVIQIIAGLYPDMPWYDSRGEGEGGYPWDEHFNSVNPAYFQAMDQRIFLLAEAGLVPCIVGFWGYFMDFAGPEVLKLHWQNLIARYAALPVAWCVAGEGLMPYYLDGAQIDDMAAWERERRASWSEMARWIRAQDGFQRPITIHPTQFGRRQVDDPTALDFEMLQTGHSGFPALTSTIDMLAESLPAAPTMPVIISEVDYEGILESSGPEIQRFLYWSSTLSGSAGFTYGANGLWQVNGEETPYGASPHGMAWGGPSWRGASQLPGSRQIGLAKQLLDAYRWWTLRAAPEKLSQHASPANRIGPYSAVLDDDTRLVFIPAPSILTTRRDGLQLLDLAPGSRYAAFYFNPKTGERIQAEEFAPDARGRHALPSPPVIQDWAYIAAPLPS